MKFSRLNCTPLAKENLRRIFHHFETTALQTPRSLQLPNDLVLEIIDSVAELLVKRILVVESNQPKTLTVAAWAYRRIILLVLLKGEE